MTIRVTCQHCGAALKIKDELAGTEGHCPKCKHKFRIPELVLAGSAEAQAAQEAPLTQPDTAPTPAAPVPASAPLPPASPPESAAAPTADDDLDCEPALLWKPDPEPVTPSAPVQASVSRPTLPLAEQEPEQSQKKPEPVVPVAADPESTEVETIPLARVEEPVRPAAKASAPVDDELEEAPRLALPPEEKTTSGPLSDDELDSGPLLALSEDDDEAPSLARPPAASSRSPEQASPSEKPKGKSKTSARSGGKDDFDPADFLSRGPSTNKRPSPSSHELLTADSSEWEAERPSREPAKKAAKSSATLAAAASEVWDHAKAARQMQRALKESVQAEQQRKPEAEEAFDWVGFFREFGLKGLGGLVACVLLAYGVYYLVDKMMGGGVPLPEIGYVSGVVTLDGNPLPGATVYFMPVEPKYPGGKKGTARTSVGITDQQGRYTLLYIDKIQGVATGNCLVWLDLMGPDGKQVIPPNHLQAAMQMREVKPGRQTIDFHLQSVASQPKK